MTNDKLKGKVDQTVGAGKKAIGKTTGDEEMEAEGKGQELKGKGQGVVGGVKDKAEELKEKVT